MIAISIGNGKWRRPGQGRAAASNSIPCPAATPELVEKEVLPLVESKCKVKLTSDPDGRATMGCSSGGSCAMIMAWYHPEWYFTAS